jgi:tRNA(Ile)-lysidine synthase
MAMVQNDILHRIRISIDWHRILDKNRAILVGVSGGPDSIALADVLNRLGEELDFTVIIAHFNHGLRSDEAERDEGFVRRFSLERNLPIEIGHGDVLELSEESGMSIEMAARKLRFEFFGKTTSENNCKVLALGHNANDQAENLILRLFRGSGGQGLGSLQPVREFGELIVVRPMLAIFRPEILSYLEWRNLDYRVDSTNFENTTDRGKIRNAILPEILDALDNIGWGSPMEALARSASLLAEDESLFNDIVAGFFSEIKSDENSVTLSQSSLKTVHPSILGRLVLKSIRNLDPDIRPDRNHVDRITMMLMGVPVGGMDLPGGIRAEISGENVIIHRPIEITSPDPVSLHLSELPAAVEFGDYVLIIDVESMENPEKIIDSRTLIDFDSSQGKIHLSIPEGLRGITIRSTGPGDRMEPLGMGGHTKKIQDIFVDTKTPKSARSVEPIIIFEFEIEGSESFIAGIPGLGLISEKVKIEPGSEKMIYISVKRK